MTNREWLESLSDEEFINEIEAVECYHCVYKQKGELPNCTMRYSDSCDCKRGMKKWLQAEHKDKED